MNPFIVNYKLPLVKITKQVSFTNSEPISYIGEYVKKTETKSYYIEAQKNTSVYDVTGFKNIFFNNLKSNGRDLFNYIVFSIGYNEDVIHLSLEKINKTITMSRPTLVSAIKQLLRENIICREENQGTYWINPYYIFKGNRIDFYDKQCPDCITVVKEINK